jgi:trans-aconitate methyltransferase
MQLLLQNQSDFQECGLLDIGCATEEFYGYLHHALPRFSYTGCDTDDRLIQSAGKKYSEGKFVFSEDLSNVGPHSASPATVFRREAVMHHPEPFAFLTNPFLCPRDLKRVLGKAPLEPLILCDLTDRQYMHLMTERRKAS